MATTVVVTTSPVAAAQSTRVSKTKMFRGRRRSAIRRALAAIRTVLAQDDRERTRGITLDYNPALVSGEGGGGTVAAFTTVRNRLARCLVLQTGDE